MVLFNMPESLYKDLELLFNDNILYARNWQTFSLKIHEMWKIASVQVNCLPFPLNYRNKF